MDYARPVPGRTSARRSWLALLGAGSVAALFGAVAVKRATTCGEGRGDCDGRWWNGCETDLGSVLDCGACGAACDSTAGVASCSAGTCRIACEPGHGDCSDAPGCETNLSETPSHCGQCGTVCESGSCRAGRCLPKIDVRPLDERLPPIVDVIPKGGAAFAVVALEVRGALPRGDVQRVIERHGRKVRSCYAAGLAASPKLAGTVRIELDVTPEGKVRTAKIAEGTNLANQDVVACVVESLSRRAFPAQAEGTLAVATLELRPAGK